MTIKPITVVMMLLATPALGQISTPDNLVPGKPAAQDGLASAEHANSQDSQAVRQLIEAGLAEVSLGNLVTEHSHSILVRDYAETMVRDHDKANEQWIALARAADIEVPDAPNADQQALRDHLETLSGDAFDQTYAEAEVEAHQQAIEILSDMVEAGENTPLRSMATAMLPIMESHLIRAEAMAAEFSDSAGGRPAEGASTP